MENIVRDRDAAYSASYSLHLNTHTHRWTHTACAACRGTQMIEQHRCYTISLLTPSHGTPTHYTNNPYTPTPHTHTHTHTLPHTYACWLQLNPANYLCPHHWPNRFVSSPNSQLISPRLPAFLYYRDSYFIYRRNYIIPGKGVNEIINIPLSLHVTFHATPCKDKTHVASHEKSTQQDSRRGRNWRQYLQTVPHSI